MNEQSPQGGAFSRDLLEKKKTKSRLFNKFVNISKNKVLMNISEFTVVYLLLFQLQFKCVINDPRPLHLLMAVFLKHYLHEGNCSKG